MTYLFMAIVIASISASLYKYVIHRIAISYGEGHAFFAQIGEKCHCSCMVYMHEQYVHTHFTILFHLKQ